LVSFISNTLQVDAQSMPPHISSGEAKSTYTSALVCTQAKTINHYNGEQDEDGDDHWDQRIAIQGHCRQRKPCYFSSPGRRWRAESDFHSFRFPRLPEVRDSARSDSNFSLPRAAHFYALSRAGYFGFIATS
jgi:hypothetical protein